MRISPFRGMPVLAGPVNTWRAGFPLTYSGTCGGPLSTPRGGFRVSGDEVVEEGGYPAAYGEVAEWLKAAPC